MAAPATRAARAASQSSMAPPKARTAEPRPGRPVSESGYAETGRCARVSAGPSIRVPLATSPGSIGQDSCGCLSGRPVVRRWLISDYGSSTGYLLFTMYGERGANAIDGLRDGDRSGVVRHDSSHGP